MDLFRSYGWIVWDSQWYGGHYLLPYSVLFPAFGATIGIYTAAAASAAAAAWAFERLLHSHFGPSTAIAASVFAVGTWVPVAIGQFGFLSGEAVGLLALLAARRNRPLLAVACAVGCPLFSPAAAAFLVLAFLTWAIAGRPEMRWWRIGLAGVAAAPLVLLEAAFPESGRFPFWGSEFVTILVVCIAGLLLIPSSQRVLRAGLITYAAAAVPLFLIANPLGGMFGRVAEGFAPAIVLALGAARGRKWLAVLAVPLLVWQVSPALAVVRAGPSDPSSNPAYFQPLLDLLSRAHGVGRLEIPFTLNHWEAAYAAAHVPLARGWERQLDMAVNPIFYNKRPFTAAEYHAWLNDWGIEWVALPDVRLDYSARVEARILNRSPEYLQPLWHNAHWRVWAVKDSPGIASGPATITSLKPDRLVLNASAAGTTTVRVRYTAAWTVTQGHACIQPTSNHWTQLIVASPGPIQIAITLTRRDTDDCRNT